MKHKILLVDDETDNLDALERLFRKKYCVLKAESGLLALELLSQNEDVSLIISDQRMPEMSGVEFLEKSQKTHPNTIRILLTGYTDIDSVISAINSGQIYRYVTKPWDSNDLSFAAEQAIEKYELISELKKKTVDLKKALDELSTLDKAKDQFMILINHELKTPLTSILSFLQILQETPLSDEQNHYLDRIDKSANKLKQIIDDVLIMVQAEAGLTPINRSKISLNQLIDPLPEHLTQFAKNKNQTLKLNIENEKNILDKTTIQNVLYRLIHNAIKFGDCDSEIEVNIKRDKDSILFQIQNKGPQISNDMIDKVLKPFTLDENSMNHSQGMGLGLSVCQSLLKHQGSQLQIENKSPFVFVSFNIILEPCSS